MRQALDFYNNSMAYELAEVNNYKYISSITISMGVFSCKRLQQHRMYLDKELGTQKIRL